jgi:hypothetical protein
MCIVGQKVPIELLGLGLPTYASDGQYSMKPMDGDRKKAMDRGFARLLCKGARALSNGEDKNFCERIMQLTGGK